MKVENVYIALIINKFSISNILSYNDVISLFNETYPNNMLIIKEYLIDGSIIETEKSLDNFINKYSSGKRTTISNTTSILITCSSYFMKNGLNILSLSLNGATSIIQNIPNVLSYGFNNKYATITNFLIYKDYQMKYIHVLYQKNDPNDLYLKDYLEKTIIQSKLLNITVNISYLEIDKYDYNIKKQSMVIILANPNSLQNYVTSKFIENFPNDSFIILNPFCKNTKNIFNTIPTLVQGETNLNFTTLSDKVYKSIKKDSDFTIYPLYDILFVLNDFTTNGLEITKENYTTINPYGSSPPAWILNTSISPIINSTPYGKFQYTFTNDVIIGKNKNLFLKYYDGGQQQLPDSYSIFKIAGITPNNASLIEYDEANYYEIYDSNNKLACVKFNSDITNFPIGKNLNVGKTIQTKFIYKYNDEGYFIKLERLYPYNEVIPQVNYTMSKVPVKLKYII